ncbi:DUF305 domain-containing protein [Deinococcus metallilatus]|uniref:DUF305 domain-containing protein n=1 Tax=Deinococcus metallilatus TaxID=1211322 RepID=A0AAJ5F216_9DEIO|nr:DUF305 domain-containing protein [Deinococcus metallilatus]MBB5296395.1 uncharacterized protein (DUF305 family) [Deinococcus metallilatus]QBY09931.1 DUF305 domain-containing protein [Deinococcus metallilatus]RXJ08655.1 DUF305 domain-containing protein [Deinococcus metallilatus]TLK25129.1 DUF305 domain-containing protein [Deinococcus metallilatus]GMA14692.1 hypothetical protein GCM10025871_10230 [Deinococcus metallilatus]
MKSKSLLLSTLTALTLAATPALAQMDHSMHGQPATTAAPVTQGMNDMGGLAGLSGKAFDRAYLSMMIAHHQGAVDMARAVQGRVKDTQVKSWVANVIRDQTREINDMTAWLKPLGGMNTGMRDMMASGMKGMVTPLKTAKNPDVAFVEGMLPHHASALDMASLALQRSNDPRVLKLSRDIIQAQADEMYAYRQWLARRG